MLSESLQSAQRDAEHFQPLSAGLVLPAVVCADRIQSTLLRGVRDALVSIHYGVSSRRHRVLHVCKHVLPYVYAAERGPLPHAAQVRPDRHRSDDLWTDPLRHLRCVPQLRVGAQLGFRGNVLSDGRELDNADDALLHTRPVQRLQDSFLCHRAHGLPRHLVILTVLHRNAARG